MASVLEGQSVGGVHADRRWGDSGGVHRLSGRVDAYVCLGRFEGECGSGIEGNLDRLRVCWDVGGDLCHRPDAQEVVGGLRLDRVRLPKAGGLVSGGAMFRLVSNSAGGKSAFGSGLGGTVAETTGLVIGPLLAIDMLVAGPIRDCFAREGRLGRVAPCSHVDGGFGSATSQPLTGRRSPATDWAGVPRCRG